MTKISSLPNLTAPDNEDTLLVVDDPSGTPVTKKITLANLSAAINRDQPELIAKAVREALDKTPPETGLPTTVAAAGLMIAGSKRKVSRRGLLGFRWFSRARL